jgi:carnitine 3-dehydrogenase
VFHTVRRRGDGTPIATGEQMHLHVDSKAAKAAPTDAAVRAKLERIARAHAELPVPPAAGRRIGQPKD